MNSNTCKTCKFWVQRLSDAPDHIGCCDAVKRLPDTLDKETLNISRPALFLDGMLLTPSTHGCNLWEAK